jgi:hypothetical protein
VLQALDFGSGPSKECTPLLKVGDFDPNLCVRVINRQLNRDAGGAARLEFGDFVMISAIAADNFVSRELVTFVILVALPACVEDAAHVTVGVSRQQETNATAGFIAVTEESSGIARQQVFGKCQTIGAAQLGAFVPHCLCADEAGGDEKRRACTGQH